MDSEILSDSLSHEELGDEILLLSIDIGDGRKGQIKIHEKDNSDQLALEFCSKHCLGARTKFVLAEEIEKNYKIALFQRAKSFHMQNHCENSTNPTRPASVIQESTERTFKETNNNIKENIKNTKITPNREQQYLYHKATPIENNQVKNSSILNKNLSRDIIKHKKTLSNQFEKNEEALPYSLSPSKTIFEKGSKEKLLIKNQEK